MPVTVPNPAGPFPLARVMLTVQPLGNVNGVTAAIVIVLDVLLLVPEAVKVTAFTCELAAAGAAVAMAMTGTAQAAPATMVRRLRPLFSAGCSGVTAG